MSLISTTKSTGSTESDTIFRITDFLRNPNSAGSVSPSVPSLSFLMISLIASPLRLTRQALSTTAALIALSSTSVFAQDNSAAEPDPRRERPEGAERRTFDPSAMRDRMNDFLRQRLEITDDAEWDIIKERIAKVTELRQTSSDNPAGSIRALAAIGGGGPGAGGREGAAAGGGPGPGGNNRQRGGREGAVPPEAVALVQALRNQSSESEIISRLEKLRAARQLAASTLAQAQEDLRIVLTPRQEAIAVITGLLP